MKEQILYIHTGQEFLPISSKISKKDLQKILSDNFVPYIECFNKCGKAGICRLTDNLRDRKSDQKCGVVDNILDNFLNVTFDCFKKSSMEDKQKYLRATTKLLELVISLESYLGAVFCKDTVEWFGDYSPALFGGLLRHRRTMGDIAFLLKQIKGFRAEIPVCLVEGPGDAELFRVFTRGVRMLNFDKLRNIDLIYGKDSTKKKRMDLLIKNKIKRGERTIVILDGDGSKSKTFQSVRKLWQQKLIKKKDVFVFKYNIELSFPLEMLFCAVQEYIDHFRLGKKISRDQVLRVIAQKGDFIKHCEQSLRIKIDKVVFDRILGHLLAYHADEHFGEIMERKPPYNEHEIFRFLEFIVKC